jgi:Raf kinase inhibitor-like YbhB/YbcL family protein
LEVHGGELRRALTERRRARQPLKKAHGATLVALSCLLCACASEDGVPAGGTSTGGTSTGGTSTGGTAGSAQGGAIFTLESPAFRNVAGCSLETPDPCEVFPEENVSYMDRPNISPELRWAGAPAGTQSFALVLFDVSYGQTHWALWNIPADVTVLAANVAKDTAMPATPAGARQSNAIFATGGDGYFGPHVPCNVFQFVLYALSISTFSPMDPESAGLVGIQLQELGDPVLGSATLTGRSNDYMTTCE